jgi:cell division protein ZapA (FtsZ GTPase activity inhibitor)
MLAMRGGTEQNGRVQQGEQEMSNRVKVEIYGKMIAVAEATQTVDSVRVAVLAAMAIADELHSGRQDTNHRDDALRERAQQCLNILERALKQTA